MDLSASLSFLPSFSAAKLIESLAFTSGVTDGLSVSGGQ
jgi:hypothetical protein